MLHYTCTKEITYLTLFVKKKNKRLFHYIIMGNGFNKFFGKCIRKTDIYHKFKVSLLKKEGEIILKNIMMLR